MAGAMVVHEFAAVIALLNTAVAVALTLLGPLWMHRPGAPTRVLANSIVGITLPIFTIFLLVTLAGPYVELWDAWAAWGSEVCLNAATTAWTEGVAAATAAASAGGFGRPMAGLDAVAILFSLGTGSSGELVRAARGQLVGLQHSGWGVVGALLSARREVTEVLLGAFETLLRLELAVVPVLPSVCSPILKTAVGAVRDYQPWLGKLLWLAVVISAFSKTVCLLRILFPSTLEPFWLHRQAWRAVCRLASGALALLRRGLRCLMRVFDASLLWPTRFCRCLGILGDLLLVPIALLWVMAPVAAVAWCTWEESSWGLYLPAGLWSLRLVSRGRRLITEAWHGTGNSR